MPGLKLLFRGDILACLVFSSSLQRVLCGFSMVKMDMPKRTTDIGKIGRFSPENGKE
jgi:hypothetical protein